MPEPREDEPDAPLWPNQTLLAEKLKGYVDRAERLTREKEAVTESFNAVLSEAAADGFDKKALRLLLRVRAAPSEELRELEELVRTYKLALGMED